MQMNDVDSDELIVSSDEASLRLDKFLALRFPRYSRQYFQYLIKEKLVLVNGALIKKGAALKEGDEIEVEFAATPEISLEPENIPLDVLYEDGDILAVNKPAGMVVHPAAGNWKHTFVNALLYHCKILKKDDSLRPGIVHRLDKETSGVLLAAKNEEAQKKLVEAFAKREMEKEYLAVCLGNPGNRRLQNLIGRHPVRRKEMAIVSDKGKEAITEIVTVAYDTQFSVVRLFPKTGRTHQLRVHLKSVGCPILGDSLYGNASLNKKMKAARQYLHAYRLKFMHPITQAPIEIKAPLAEDMRNCISGLVKNEAFDPTR